MSFLRLISLSLGCIPVDTTKALENFHESQLTVITHKWPEMEDLQVELFNEFADQITVHEIDLYEALNLPSIDEVRAAALINEREYPGTWEYKIGYGSKIDSIFRHWASELLPITEEERKNPTAKIFPRYQLAAFAIGVERTFKQTLDSIGNIKITKEDIIRNKVEVAFDNLYYQRAYIEGAQKILANFSSDKREKIKLGLARMAQEGRNPLVIARWLRKEAGEGKAWYWRMLARSETVLALNMAQSASFVQYQVPYETWTTSSSGYCPICASFKDNTYRVNEGPQPVTDSHPNCRCTRDATYVTDGPIKIYPKRDPYTRPYKRDELELLQMQFGGDL